MVTDPPILYYAIHHTAVSRTLNSTQLDAVNRYHREKWGRVSTLGWYVVYNYFIDATGVVTPTRVVGEETIAQVGHNCDVRGRCDTISVCLTGDFNTEVPNDAQVVALRELVAELESQYPLIKPKLHRELQMNRTCPGSLLTHDYLQRAVLGLTDPYDPDDREKAKRIAQLSQLLDSLKALYRLLISLGWRK